MPPSPAPAVETRDRPERPGPAPDRPARLWPRNDNERTAAIAAGYDVTKVLTTDDLFAGDDGFFSMTAITDGDFLRGVRYFDFGAITHSMVVRAKTGTVRTIETIHRHDKNASFSTAGL